MPSDFQGFLSAKLREKNLNLRKLSELSGIALRHLENLNSGNFGDLPSAPYVRGYLKKIGEILEFNSEEWWQILKHQEEIKSSGVEDELPKNRFLKKPQTKKIIVIIIAVIVLSYFGFRFSQIFGRPEIILTYPQGEGILTSTNQEITIQGTLKNGDKILIGNEEIPVSSDGSWQKTVPLTSSTPNNIEITAKKFLGRETKLTLQIIYEPPKEAAKKIILPAPTSTPSSTDSQNP
ncbi:MAG: helix-turn-helix domain-containing protein [Patescibacteria group bacterium]